MQIQSFTNIKFNPRADLYFGLGAVNIVALGFIFGFLNPGNIDTDGGTFAAIAFKDMNGGTLYLDTWDHKPPGIYYLMELFFTCIPDKIYALYVMAILGVLGLVNGLYFITQYLMKSLVFSLLVIILFIIIGINSLFLGDGLYTEIFGSVLLIWSLFAFHHFESKKVINYAYLAVVLSGFSCWFKEPFIVFTIPLVIILMIKINDWKLILKLLGFLLLPSVLFILLLLINGSLYGFLDMIVYNFSYANTDSPVSKSEQFQTLWENIIHPLNILAGIILLTGFKCIADKTNRLSFTFNILLLIGGLLFIFISPHNFNHYYLPFIVIFFYSFVSFLHYDKSMNKGFRWIISVLVLYSIFQFENSHALSYRAFFKPYKPDKITEILRKDATKTLFIDLVDASEYYIKADKIFPTFLAVPVAYHFNESKQGLINRNRIYKELIGNKPDFLITDESCSYMYCNLPEHTLYVENYERIDSIPKVYRKMIYLWKLKSDKK